MLVAAVVLLAGLQLCAAFRPIMDVWSGLPDAQYRTARVMSVATAALQATTALLLAVPLLSLRRPSSDAAHSATILALSLTVLCFVAALSIALPAPRPPAVVTAGTAFGGCLAAAALLCAGKLAAAVRRSRKPASYVIAGLAALHAAGVLWFVLAAGRAVRSGDGTGWSVPVVRSPRRLKLPHRDVCRTCGGTNIIGTTFDDWDYDLLADVLDGRDAGDDFIFWVSPYGPGAGHSRGWSEMTFECLRREMPRLREDTYDSFVERNRTAAAHFRPRLRTRSGRTVRVAGEGSRNIQPPCYTRAGFAADRSQALIYCGGGNAEVYSLWEKRDGKWRSVDCRTARWML